MTQRQIQVREDGKDLAYGFADIMAYHGFGFPGGVAHAVKVMELALPLLDDGTPPERREIHIRTAFRGPGARDAFEMVTRCLTEGRYTVDPSLERPERGETLARYVFELSYRGKTFCCRSRMGMCVTNSSRLAARPNGRRERKSGWPGSSRRWPTGCCRCRQAMSMK